MVLPHEQSRTVNGKDPWARLKIDSRDYKLVELLDYGVLGLKLSIFIHTNFNSFFVASTCA